MWWACDIQTWNGTNNGARAKTTLSPRHGLSFLGPTYNTKHLCLKSTSRPPSFCISPYILFFTILLVPLANSVLYSFSTTIHSKLLVTHSLPDVNLESAEASRVASVRFPRPPLTRTVQSSQRNATQTVVVVTNFFVTILLSKSSRRRGPLLL